MLHRYPCPDRNLLLMIQVNNYFLSKENFIYHSFSSVQLILLDAGGTIYASAIVSDDVRAYDPHNVVRLCFQCCDVSFFFSLFFSFV